MPRYFVINSDSAEDISSTTTMNIQEFVENFAAQFDETEPEVFAADTNFKELDEWSSLTALSIIAMVDDEYDVIIKGNDILRADTIQDLFQIVESKKKK